jgi:hypothetical protein
MPRAYILGWVTMLAVLAADPSVIRPDILFLALLCISAVHQSQSGNPLHQACCGIAQEFTAGLECSIDADMVLRGGEEIARLRRVVGGLFGDVVAAGSIRVVPVASEGFSEDRVERLLHSAV